MDFFFSLTFIDYKEINKTKHPNSGRRTLSINSSEILLNDWNKIEDKIHRILNDYSLNRPVIEGQGFINNKPFEDKTSSHGEVRKVTC